MQVSAPNELRCKDLSARYFRYSRSVVFGLHLRRALSRDYRKLRVFHEADALVLEIYRVTVDFPNKERYGLQSQIRRACVSCAANIVEGSSRRSTPDYCRFLEVAHGSAREVAYLLSVARRLGFLREEHTKPLEQRYDILQRMLQSLIDGLATSEASRKTHAPKPQASRPKPAMR
jgi:four helix bundle protein